MFKFMETIVKKLLTQKITVGCKREVKVKFEKEILKVLKKFDLLNDKQSCIQRVEIVVDTYDLPKVVITSTLFDKITKKK